MRWPLSVFWALCLHNTKLPSALVKDDLLVNHPGRAQHCVCVGTVILKSIAPRLAFAFSVQVRLGNPLRYYSSTVEDNLYRWKASKPEVFIDCPASASGKATLAAVPAVSLYCAPQFVVWPRAHVCVGCAAVYDGTAPSSRKHLPINSHTG